MCMQLGIAGTIVIFPKTATATDQITHSTLRLKVGQTGRVGTFGGHRNDFTTSVPPEIRMDNATMDGLKAHVVAMANANRAIYTDDFETVRAVVDGSPLVFWVFQDQSQQDGVGWLRVKGHALLREIVANGKDCLVDMAAVLLHMRRTGRGPTAGDGRKRHPALRATIML